MSETINKYPVFYNGEEYEIRIEEPYDGVDYFYTDAEYVIIYKVIKHKNWLGGTKITYEKVHEENKKLLMYNYENNNNGSGIMTKDKAVDINSDDYYIQLFKKAFNLYKAVLEKEKAEERKLVALQEWDGVIE